VDAGTAILKDAFPQSFPADVGLARPTIRASTENTA
jgi:hypothetical protein